MPKEKHGGVGTKLYWLWKGMNGRCRWPSATNYAYYGGSGISVCQEWQDFATFRDWANSTGYSQGMTLDRIDSTKNYCPENCRWATMAEQGRNRRSNLMVTVNGTQMCVTDAAKIVGVTRSAIYQRLERGWSIERALQP